MYRGLVALVVVSGCRSVFGLGDPQLRSDAGGELVDVAPDASDLCFGTAPQVCLTALPTIPLHVEGAIDTDVDSSCVPVALTSGVVLCVIAGTTLTAKGVTATGARPLVLIALTQLTVEGSLDVSSRRTLPSGAGANAACLPIDGAPDGLGGSGGAGGSFGSKGGNGGDGSGGAPGTVALGPTTTTVLRGGCRGGTGGVGSGAGSGGAGGASGGAVALYARSEILIPTSAGVFASGAGGGPGNENSGTQNRGAGGGGGSGGMIILDAPTISTGGVVTANGGGGGGGGDCCSGSPGGDGSTGAYATPASGGANEGNGKGGTGGHGAAGSTLAADGLAPATGGGGGGGGGGHGIVIVRGAISGTGKFSPSPLP